MDVLKTNPETVIPLSFCNQFISDEFIIEFEKALQLQLKMA